MLMSCNFDCTSVNAANRVFYHCLGIRCVSRDHFCYHFLFNVENQRVFMILMGASIPRAGQIGNCRQRLATAATFLCCPGAS